MSGQASVPSGDADIGIAAIASYLPGERIDNAYLVEKYGFDEAFLRDKVGITGRHVAAADEAVSDMAVQAAERLFDATGLDRSSIGLVLLCTQNPDYRLPTTANLVQTRTGLPNHTAAFDINQGCSGYVYALGIAKAFMALHGISHGLVLTSEAYSKVMNPADRDTAPLFGDAATATLLQAGAPLRLGAFSFGSDGSGGEDLIVRGGGSRHPDRMPVGKDALYMNGRAVFNFAVKRVPQDIRACLDKNRLQVDDIDLFLLHQANKFMLEALGRNMKLPAEKLPIRVSETANTVSNTIPLLIQALGGVDALRGKRSLLSGFGVGLSWASTIVYG